MGEKININDIVKVKLTDFGKEIYYHQFDELNASRGRAVIEPFYPKVNEDGYTSFQLWYLMDLYGRYLSITGTVDNNTLPFETTILIN